MVFCCLLFLYDRPCVELFGHRQDGVSYSHDGVSFNELGSIGQKLSSPPVRPPNAYSTPSHSVFTNFPVVQSPHTIRSILHVIWPHRY